MVWTRMSEFLFQSRCVFCQESAPIGRDICQFCVADLPQSPDACLRCAIPLTTTLDKVYGLSTISPHGRNLSCGRCLRHPPPVQRTLALCHYAYPADFLVQQLKFARQLKYARVMGLLMADAIAASELGQPCDAELLIPMPLSTQRYRQRGFNQATEIARFVAAGLSRNVNEHVLYRKLDQAPQAGLDRSQRRRNIRGAFAVSEKLGGERCVLIDDVMTTGATAYEAASALVQAGAGAVDLWVFARTV